MSRTTRLAAVFVSTLLAVASSAAPAIEDAFDPDADSGVLELASEVDRDAFAEALADAGGNWHELAGAVRALDGEERAACVALIRGMPHLDRLEMTAETLTEHVRLAFRARSEMPYGVPDDMFEPYILTYRIEEEPVEPWRAQLYERFAPTAIREGGIVATARALNIELNHSVEERDSGFFGPRQSPLLTLKSGSGTQAEIAILACAALKAVGIPSRQAAVRALGEEEDGAHWIEIYDGSNWLPLFPLDPEALGDFGHLELDHPKNVTVVSSRSSFERVLVTEHYTETGSIEFSFVDDGSPAAGFEHFSVNVLNNGALVPLDSLEAVADEDGRFAAVVGEGSYVALAGIRDAVGNPFVMMREVDVAPGEVVRVAFDVTPRGEVRGLDAREIAAAGVVMTAVFLFDPDDEPSARMLPLVAGAARDRAPSVNLVCAYRDGESRDEAGIASLAGPRADVVALDPAAGHFVDASGVRTEFPDEGVELPVVRVYEIGTGEVVLDHTGYDLNIARRLEAAIDARLAEILAERADRH